MRDSVFALLEKHCHYDRRITDVKRVEETSRVIEKYLWLITKYNEAISREMLPVGITYEVVVNDKLNRFEIVKLKKGSWPIVAN